MRARFGRRSSTCAQEREGHGVTLNPTAHGPALHPRPPALVARARAAHDRMVLAGPVIVTTTACGDVVGHMPNLTAGRTLRPGLKVPSRGRQLASLPLSGAACRLGCRHAGERAVCDSLFGTLVVHPWANRADWRASLVFQAWPSGSRPVRRRSGRPVRGWRRHGFQRTVQVIPASMRMAPAAHHPASAPLCPLVSELPRHVVRGDRRPFAVRERASTGWLRRTGSPGPGDQAVWRPRRHTRKQ